MGNFLDAEDQVTWRFSLRFISFLVIEDLQAFLVSGKNLDCLLIPDNFGGDSIKIKNDFFVLYFFVAA